MPPPLPPPLVTFTDNVQTAGIIIVSVLTILTLSVFLAAAFGAQHHLSPAEMKELGLRHLVSGQQR